MSGACEVGEKRSDSIASGTCRGSLRTRLGLAVALLACPLVVLGGLFIFGERAHAFVGLCVTLLALCPFALTFERRRPQARELILMAVMIALTVAGRMAFFMIPQFKPMAALVIVSGVWLGPESGFLIGAMSALVSNFFFGQGPWTPWQMLGMGLIGCLAGVVFRRVRQGGAVRRVPLATYGFIATFAIYGLLVDTSSVLYAMGMVNGPAIVAVYLAGIPFNLIHAASTAFFLSVLGLPLGRKLDRMKCKYGL